MNFSETLTATYCDHPCQVLPNALWKTLDQIENLQTDVRITGSQVSHLAAYDDERLLLCWTRQRERLPELNLNWPDMKLAIVHQDHLKLIPCDYFSIRKPYFRLIQNNADHQLTPSLPESFRFADVKIQDEYQQVSTFISRCYPDMHPTPEIVLSWTQHPVFEQKLWVWVIDLASGIRAALGIAEYDHYISEGSLEWIQVLPEYRGQGLGKAVVLELLSRLNEQVAFTTVAGEKENATNPEALYRKCGFQGSNVWWLLKS